MVGKNKGKGKNDFMESCSVIVSGVVNFFLVVLVLVFPLIYDNSYFNILETKYACYYLIVMGMTLVLLLLSISFGIVDQVEYKGACAKQFFSGLAPRNWNKTVRWPDLALMAFLLIAAISTFCSDYVYESFWGNEGRFTGLFLLLLYGISYFLISRFWGFKGRILELFLISGLIMCLIGITDYFQMDILHFRVRIKPDQSAMFVSTIGNINTYTAYVGLLIGLAATLFATAKAGKRLIWYYVCTVTGFFAIIMGCSDNAYLSLGALFGLLPLLVFRSWTGMKRYAVLVASFFSVVQIIDWINIQFEGQVIGLESLFKLIVNFRGLHLIVIALWFLVVVMCYYEKRRGLVREKLNKTPVRVWLAFLVLTVLGILAIWIDANFGNNSERYAAVSKYLVFNDAWGTHRGYIWRVSMEMYQELPLFQKIFGHGPDTFGIMAVNGIGRAEMLNATGNVYDNPHNEYLQYLVTIGPFGLMAYLAFLFSSVRRFLKDQAQNPYVYGCCFAVLGYAVQAVVNLNLPIATPMMWLLLSVGMAGVRRVGAER